MEKRPGSMGFWGVGPLGISPKAVEMVREAQGPGVRAGLGGGGGGALILKRPVPLCRGGGGCLRPSVGGLCQELRQGQAARRGGESLPGPAGRREAPGQVEEGRVRRSARGFSGRKAKRKEDSGGGPAWRRGSIQGVGWGDAGNGDGEGA